MGKRESQSSDDIVKRERMVVIAYPLSYPAQCTPSLSKIRPTVWSEKPIAMFVGKHIHNVMGERSLLSSLFLAIVSLY